MEKSSKTEPVVLSCTAGFFAFKVIILHRHNNTLHYNHFHSGCVDP